MGRNIKAMNCSDFEENVVAISEKALPQDVGASLEEHRRQCKRCASLATHIERVLRETLPGEDEATLSHRFWPEVLQQVGEHDRQGFVLGKLGLRPVALTACLVLAVWAGIQLGNIYTDRTLVAGDYEEIEEPIVPYLDVLDDVPHDSLAELLLQGSLEVESKP